MSILLDKSTRVIVQGITGREGQYHTHNMIAAGTTVVGGVTPGKGGQEVEGVPVFDTVAQAKARTDANATCIFVPPAGAADAIEEAAYAGIELIVCITEGIPVVDMTRAILAVREKGATLIGPNCPGLCTPGHGKIGIIPYGMFTPGPVGFISRSGTLTYEVVSLLTNEGLGQSTCIGIGGDPIIGSTFADYLKRFDEDPQTEVVVMCGEIGGSDEEDAAEYIRTQMKKPVVAFISGRTAPPGKRMGHAGAIVSGNTGTAQGKVEALQAAGVPVADTIFDVPALVKKVLSK
ncbi:succinate--CoA ligase [ADP-forming] subunit alpha [Ktedonobacter sp. SOSP1-85]|uniref:Succinate--CoA ligase [ADP-forming] subunit alpha n=1 Tax=Ktedonobacter robiniae TaxID=2778365 RepID=A0ABQ3UGI5_9CHLR|nr:MULTISPECIES: succinate--CoA ligase subunit alpha [Ktedonobacter]GHO51552.1 succinate--CoA ligase [ADP-forming] subunit alpha [Ktedonobacter robiniae]GHO64904.1 succinate--CoA ligase [ADP-forming] subunit alpha [Ktedonobacter sp. SOSP1-52]GHO77325.1 succinate--CoA ligase [ADP-forming] subunit alpha [Ktedonobacter sp. SOSP1-85]